MAEEKRNNFISGPDLDKLIAAHDGDVALLWLYRQRYGALDAEKAAHDLCRTLQEIRAAEEKLRRMELFAAAPAPTAAPVAPPPSVPEPDAVQELPQYSSDEISRRSRGNSALDAIYAEAAQVMGRALGGNDLRVLFGIYDHLGLPPEVILELLHFCEELCHWKYGDSRRPTPRFLEKEAYSWANREILTLEQAEEYIRFRRSRHGDLGSLRERLHLQELSPTQEKELNAWLDQGFREDAIVIAADRTVTNTGSLKWNYLRKILLSWQEKGLFTPELIEEKDPARRDRVAASAPGVRTQQPLSSDEWDRILDKI